MCGEQELAAGKMGKCGEDGGSLFEPQSTMCRVSREALGLLGGGYAILLQLAHPMVAAGVAQHSEFQRDPLARLLGTMQLMHTLVFSERQAVEKALRRFQAVHERIQGRLPAAAGRFAAGAGYSAADPHLKLWVMATLVEAGLATHQRFVEPLTEQQRERFYAESCVLGRLLGVPETILPPTMEAFDDYMARMMDSDTITVTDTARRLARQVLNPEDVGAVPAACAGLLRFVTAGLTPEPFRTDYGLSWNTRRQTMLNALSSTTRLLRPISPRWVWQSPTLGRGLPRLLLWGVTGTREFSPY